MADIPKENKGDEEYAMLEADELFFPRNDKGEIIAKKTFVEERIPRQIKVKEKIKDKDGIVLKDEKGKDRERTVTKTVYDVIRKGILITPLPRGEWVELTSKSKDGETTEDQDTIILEQHLISPKVKADELRKAGKHFLISKIVQKILEFSSLVFEKGKKKVNKDQ